MTIFYTAYLVNEWRSIVAEQLEAMKSSGLLDDAKLVVHAFPTASSPELVSMLSDIPRCQLQVSSKNEFEIPALEAMLACEDDICLYLHTKGVTKNAKHEAACTANWRRYMMHWCVGKWRRCVELLNDGADAVGVEFKTQPFKHFSGNFFWTTRQHLQHVKRSGWRFHGRLSAEEMIGSAHGKYISLHNVSLNLYKELLDLKSIEKEELKEIIV